MNGQHTYQEITTQPTAWEDALAVFAKTAPTLTQSWQTLNPNHVLFIGCGSTHYLSVTAAALFQQLTGIVARACPASELLLFGQTIVADPAKTLLVAISRSGTTTETITAVSKFQQQGGAAVWTITCYPDSPLAQQSDIVLSTVAAQEQSIAQTRSFASMLLSAQALAAHLGDEDWTLLH
ncbi:MAG: SIS domain-containing protein, partial [Chloroflexi bacterium]